MKKEGVAPEGAGTEAGKLSKKIIDVKLDKIIINKELYPRIETNEETIVKYSEVLEVLPPIIINQDNVLIDGLHRLKAHERHDRTIVDTIKCIVEKTKDDTELMLRAIELNSTHGLQLSYKEKRGLAVKLFDIKNSKRLIKCLGITHDCFNKWVRDKRYIMQKETEDGIIEDYLVNGKTQKEIAKKYDVHDTKVTELKKQILEEINLLFSKRDKAPNDLKLKYGKMVGFKIMNSNFWNGIYEVNLWRGVYQNEETNEETYKGILDKDTLIKNLLHHYTKPFDVVYDLTKESEKICKDFYRSYIAGDNLVSTSKNLNLIILDTSNDYDSTIVENLKPKIKNGYIAVLTNDNKENYVVTEKVLGIGGNLENTIILPYVNCVENGNKLNDGYKTILIFSFKSEKLSPSIGEKKIDPAKQVIS